MNGRDRRRPRGAQAVDDLALSTGYADVPSSAGAYALRLRADDVMHRGVRVVEHGGPSTASARWSHAAGS